MNRRFLLQLLVGFAAIGILPTSLFAAPLLNEVTMFVPAAPGGGWDGTARAIESASRDAGLVGSFRFENVAGSGGMVGLPRFVNQYRGKGAALMVGGSVMVGAGLANKSPLTIKDIVPIAQLTEESGVLVVPENSPIKTLADFVKAIQANPKAVSVAGGSAGGTDHILLGLILKSEGKNPKDAAYVAFSGGGASVAAVLGGQVSAGISGYSEYEAHIASGKMRALAVSGRNRIPGVAIPTLTEQGVKVVAANWRGVFAAPDITAADKQQLVQWMQKMATSPQWKALLAKNKWTDVFETGSDFENSIKDSLNETAYVLKEVGLLN